MATLKSLVDETTNIKNEIVEHRDALKQILIDKKIEGLESINKLSILINKTNELEAPSKMWLYKDGIDYAGFDKAFNNGGTNTSVLTKYSTYMQSNTPAVSSWVSRSTASKLDITKYSKFGYEIQLVTKTTLDIGGSLDILTNTGSWTILDASKIAICSLKVTNKEPGIYQAIMDISSINGSYYLNVRTSWGGTRITKIWLEK